MIVDIFIPCFVDQVYPQTAWNMIKILEKLGCEVRYNENQTCCGQPAWNSGFKSNSRTVASKWLDDFKSPNYIVSPSGSCVGMIRSAYHEIFNNTSRHLQCKSAQLRTYEFTEFLTDVLKVENVGARMNVKATYHDSCGALRECGIKEGPRRLLSNVEGLELVEMKDVETCCGFGGTFAVKFEEISTAMADQKVNNALETGAEVIISTDLSCLMHIEAYIKKKELPLKTMHIADVLVEGW